MKRFQTKSLRLAMAQIDTTVGDLESNTAKIVSYMDRARQLDVDLITFPELAVTGYPPEDLLLKPEFIEANLVCLEEIVAHTAGITAVVGFVDRDGDIFNAAAVAQGGKLLGVYHKMYLPNYGVFDEFRYFGIGCAGLVFVLNGVIIGVSICEDVWYPTSAALTEALKGGAEVMVNISSSPYHAGKRLERQRMLATRAADNLVIVAYNNLVGGQDELVFDGNSVVFDAAGNVLAQGAPFKEQLIVADLDVTAVFRKRLHDTRRRQEQIPEGTVDRLIISDRPSGRKKSPLPVTEPVADLSREAEIYQALVLGTRDYVLKNGFRKVVIGLSGGIDSALTAVIACDALGPDRVVGVFMPSQYSSHASASDAETLARNLGIECFRIPIQEPFESYKRTLKEVFANRPEDVTEENLQARIRGNFLMALSNKFGWLVLTTGNKSELGAGYCTLYGDMAGGFGVIKDVPKTLVYRLANYRNRVGPNEIIPENTIRRAPSAELRPDQKDSDTLPEYEILDVILHAYIEEDKSLYEITEMGYDEKLVKAIIDKVDSSEYKRRQSSPGVKITPRAFGRDRRMPITNRFHFKSAK